MTRRGLRPRAELTRCGCDVSRDLSRLVGRPQGGGVDPAHPRYPVRRASDAAHVRLATCARSPSRPTTPRRPTWRATTSPRAWPGGSRGSRCSRWPWTTPPRSRCSSSRSPTGFAPRRTCTTSCIPSTWSPRHDLRRATGPDPAARPRRPHLAGPRRPDAGPHPALRAGVDRPQPERPRDHPAGAVRLARRGRRLPAQPGAGQELHRVPQPARDHPRPAHARAHLPHLRQRRRPGRRRRREPGVDGGARGPAPHRVRDRRGRARAAAAARHRRAAGPLRRRRPRAVRRRDRAAGRAAGRRRTAHPARRADGAVLPRFRRRARRRRCGSESAWSGRPLPG